MFGHGHKHHPPPPAPAGGGYPPAPMAQDEPTFKIFCRADEAYCLTIRHDAVVLAPTNPRDEYQAPLVQGHEAQHAGEGRGGPPGVRAREPRHGPRRQALARPVPPGEARALQPGVPRRVGALDGEQRRRQGLPLHPHGQQHPPQLRRPPRRQGPRRGARRDRRRALGVVQGRQPELEDPPMGRWRRLRTAAASIRRRRLVRRPGSLCAAAAGSVWRWRVRAAAACSVWRWRVRAAAAGSIWEWRVRAASGSVWRWRVRAPAAAECARRRGVRAPGHGVWVWQPAPYAGVGEHCARSLQGRRGLQPHGQERGRVPRAQQPQRRIPALGEGHEAQHPDQGRGRLPCVCTGEQGHRRSHQALPRTEPPGEACGLQPGVRGRVGAVDGEQGRGQGFPLHPHGEQHLPQLRRPPRRQGPRRRPRRHRDRALGVVQGRQPALEDRPMVERDVV